MSSPVFPYLPSPATGCLMALTGLALAVETLAEADPTLFGTAGSIEGSTVGQACAAGDGPSSEFDGASGRGARLERPWQCGL